MKLTVILLMAAVFHAAAEGRAQTVTLKVKDASLKTVFKEIKRQAGYDFFYNDEVLEKAGSVSMDVKNASINEVLALCFKDQPLEFSIEDNSIVVKSKRIMTVPPPVTSPPAGISIKGRITNEAGEPVQVSITIKGTRLGTTSNADGYYELNFVDVNATLLITGVSIEPIEVKVDGRTRINVTVKIRVAESEEVVVAYNKISQRSNVGSITVIKGDQIESMPYRSFDKSLQGLVPGLQITQGTGQPGGATSSFVLRGISTGGIADNGSTVRNPLVIIDGMPINNDPAHIGSSNAAAISNPLAQLNPSNIESITILKDAAAVALYGSKASNGVILITTKRGKAGKTVFNIRHQLDFSERLIPNYQMLTQGEYLELVYEAYRNADPTRTNAQIKSDLISKFPYRANGTDTSFYPVSDWIGEIYNNHAATYVTELSMSGGTERSIFYLNFEWTKQDGIAKSTGYDRKSIRFNFDHRPASWFKLGLSSELSYNVQNYSSVTDFGLAPSVIMSPLNPVRNDSGNYIMNYAWGLTSTSGRLLSNPAAAAEYDVKKNTAFRALVNIKGDLRITRHFSFSSNLGLDFMFNEAIERTDPRFSNEVTVLGIGKLTEFDSKRPSVTTTNMLKFNRSFSDKHVVGLLLGQEAQVQVNKTLSATKTNLDNINTDQMNGASVVVSVLGDRKKQTMLSFFGQANYSYKDKIFLSGSARTDGSSRFGENERFGSLYWSAGAGWVVSQEPFMKPTRRWVNYLKLRGSMGVSGNSAGILDAYRYDRLARYVFLNNGALVPYYIGGTPGNPSIKWEETFSYNAGLELRSFKDKVALTFDYYRKKTTNLIDYINIPSSTGYGKLYHNIGDIVNQGVELTLSVNVLKRKDLSWDISGNWSKNTNKLTKSFFPVNTTTVNQVANEVGRNYNSFYMNIWAGVDPMTGKPLWIDSTGKPSSNFNAGKKQFVGKPQPDGFGSVTNSVSFQNITLAATLYFSYGFQVYDQASVTLINDGTNAYLNQRKEALNRWQKPGDVAANPRRMLNSTADRGTESSTRYLFDGDFLRLSNVKLSYSLPKKLINRLHLSGFNVYIQGHNLAIWTKYGGNDPESSNGFGINSFAYPLQRSYSAGLNVSF